MNLLSKIATAALAVILTGSLVITGVQGSNSGKKQIVEETELQTTAVEEVTTKKAVQSESKTTKATTKSTQATTTQKATATTEETTEEQLGNTGYSLYVNIPWNCITVYYHDEPIKAIVCSVGVGGENSTPEGTFYVSTKARWGEMNGPCWAQYLTNITGSYWFHSVPNSEPYDPSSLWYGAYNNLGQAASHGCVRLSVADASYIYYNIPYGSEIVCYYDYSSPGPLGKPSGRVIPTELVGIRGWDPTDPDSDNPWHTYDVSITGPDSITVDPKTSLDTIKSKFSAVDSTGNSVLDFCDFTLNGVDLDAPGSSGTLTITFDYSGYGLCCRTKTCSVRVNGEPVTTEPTTEEPSSEEPTTEEPTTEEPTTEETEPQASEEPSINEPL